MSKLRRIRQHVNPLRKEYQRAQDAGLSLPIDQPIEVELGCADARYSFTRARAEPDRLFVGLEIRDEMVRYIERKVRAEKLGNLRIVYGNMNFDLPVLFGAARISRYHLLFPDPWLKKKHKKRRVVNDELICDLAATLAPGGEVAFASDIWDLSLDAMAALELREELFENCYGAWSFAPDLPGGARSKRDMSCAKKGWPVWRLRYRKRAT